MILGNFEKDVSFVDSKRDPQLENQVQTKSPKPYVVLALVAPIFLTLLLPMLDSYFLSLRSNMLFPS